MNSESAFGVLDFLAWDHGWNDHHYPLEKVRQAAVLIQQAGVGFVRMDFLWSDLEPAPGQFDFTKYDLLVEILHQHNLGILGLLHYNPSWRPGSWNAAPSPPDYERYASTVVRHFKRIVKYWEIWNEPDHPAYWQPQDGLTAYSNLLKAVYPVLKKENPDCRILLGGLSKTVPDSLDQIYRQAGRESFDIVNIHPFVSPVAGEALKVLRQVYEETLAVMARYGDEKKPIWFTEVGCPGVPAADAASVSEWWLGQNPTEIQQAEWVRTLYSEALQWKGVEKIFWAFFRDTAGHFKDGVDFFGLVRHDFSLKPAYQAYQAVTSTACKEADRNPQR